MINTEKLEQLLTDIPEGEFGSFLRLYFSESKANLDAVKSAVGIGDLETFNYHVHKEASSSLIFGLEEYGNYLRGIEAAIGKSVFDMARFDLQALCGLADSAHASLRAACAHAQDTSGTA